MILFNQPILGSVATQLRLKLNSQAHLQDTVFFILTTYGGDAHAAYIVARELQLRYKKIILCVAGDCFSAGTLIVMGAHELVVADRGRLGPVDVQLKRKDEVMERLSGLAVGTAIRELEKRASQALLNIAIDLTLELKQSPFGHLSFRTALDVSANMVARMYGEIYKQIDPIKVGEDAMALEIARHYGKRIGRDSANLKGGAIDRLLEGYPSHECIIDRKEAEELFNIVREPGANESHLLSTLSTLATDPKEPGIIHIFPHVPKEKKAPEKEEPASEEVPEQSEDRSNGRKRSSKPRTPEAVGGGARPRKQSDPRADIEGTPPD